MKSLLTCVSLLPAVLLATLAVRPCAARAEETNLLRTRPIEPLKKPADRPLPRLKLSFVRFNAGHPAGGTIALQSLHLDMYAFNWRWLRIGVDAEGGLGHTTLAGAGTNLRYGLLGVSAGLQIPGRITPFIEARVAGGIMAGTVEDPVTIPGTNVDITGVSAATWMWARGVDIGAEIYTFGRAYVSVGVGWIRTTWRSADFSNSTGGATGLSFKDVTHDSFMFKIGVGF
jgi:hypothetical protein